jgi:hypothetical protein
MREKEATLLVIGFLLFAFGFFGILNQAFLEDIGGVFWLCYTALILMGIGILRKNDFLITSQLNLLAIPLIVWTVDFFYFLISGASKFGIVDYLFSDRTLLSTIVSTQHLFTLPLGLICLWLIGLKRKDSWVISAYEILLIYVITILFTSERLNINCVYESCVDLGFSMSGIYALWWFVSMFVMVFVTNFVLVKIFYKKKVESG